MKYINEFNESDNIVGTYLCKQKTYAQTKTGKEYINLVMADKTGSLNCKIWDPNSMGIGDFDVNDYVELHGKVSVFNGALQMSIDRTRKAAEGTYNPADYLPVSERSVDEMYKELTGFVKSVQAPYYRMLLENLFLNDEGFISSFKEHSAAKSVHHGFVGGLLQHTVAVAGLCDIYASRYPMLNRDLLITAALCHDIGKVRELSDFPTNDYTDEGNLLGHIVMGVEIIDEKIADINGFPVKRATELKHCILAHHGEFEYGSPKKPALIEAVALNFADNTDAKLQAMTEVFENAKNTTPIVGAAADKWLGFNKIFDSNIRPTD